MMGSMADVHKRRDEFCQRGFCFNGRRDDVTWDNVASDKSEGKMENNEADEEMVLEEETSRFEVAVQ